MSAWLSTGVIARKTQEKGHHISLPDDWTVDDREDLVAATVADGLQLFRQALVDNRWNPENHASLRTYFLSGCIRAFPNVLRRWGNDRQRYRQAVIASAREATVQWQAVEPIDIVDAVDTLRSLTRDEDQRSREITHLYFDNYNPAEIARVLDIAPEKVRATLRRLRRHRLDDRDSGSLTD
jgi:DNA-directed RNA polymerase specialized sigma24 family protein